jgi:D-alanine-D-alanine ligase
MMQAALKVMVLAGGPDRERSVSLESGDAVTEALEQAGHDVRRCDIGPQDLSALDTWQQWPGDVVFPVLPGVWGEGGPLQEILHRRHIPHVGCGPRAARLCMDKHQTKQALVRHGIRTPAFELVTASQPPTLKPPLVVKALCEGSSIDLMVCHDAEQLEQAQRQLGHHERLLVERFVAGQEITVGVVAGEALAPVWIVPAGGFYDFDAKYHREDTRYVLDPHQMSLGAGTIGRLERLAVQAHDVLGCRHMCRVDFIVDDQDQPWILEVNTIPGFTGHSLFPKAAAFGGVTLPKLVDRLVGMAVDPA